MKPRPTEGLRQKIREQKKQLEEMNAAYLSLHRILMMLLHEADGPIEVPAEIVALSDSDLHFNAFRLYKDADDGALEIIPVKQ